MNGLGSFTVTRTVGVTGFVYLAILPPPIPPAPYEMVIGSYFALEEAIEASGRVYDQLVAEGRRGGISWLIERDGIDGSEYFEMEDEGEV